MAARLVGFATIVLVLCAGVVVNVDDAFGEVAYAAAGIVAAMVAFSLLERALGVASGSPGRRAIAVPLIVAWALFNGIFDDVPEWHTPGVLTLIATFVVIATVRGLRRLPQREHDGLGLS